MCLGEFFGETINVIEIAVRFILVFLVQFGIAETFVVEFGSIVFG